MRVLSKLSALLYPNEYTCAVCGSEWPLNRGYLCAECARRLTRITVCCPVCGRSQTDTEVCRQCHSRSFDRAFSVFDYTGSGKQSIISLKFRHDLRAASAMAQEMASVLPADLDYDLITFVPATKRSLKNRGFNQAQLLAQNVAQITGKPILPCLNKSDSHVTQHSLNRAERYANAEEVFSAIAGIDINGKSVLLTDDIFTTGATADACAKVLKNAGASRVFVLTFVSVPNF